LEVQVLAARQSDLGKIVRQAHMTISLKVGYVAETLD